MFDRWSQGGVDITPETYNGRMVRLEGGTRIGLRESSLTGKAGAGGNATMDITYPNGKTERIHIVP